MAQASMDQSEIRSRIEELKQELTQIEQVRSEKLMQTQGRIGEAQAMIRQLEKEKTELPNGQETRAAALTRQIASWTRNRDRYQTLLASDEQDYEASIAIKQVHIAQLNQQLHDDVGQPPL